MTYEILPTVTALTAVCLGALTFAGTPNLRRRLRDLANAPSWASPSDFVGVWALQEARAPHLRLVTTRFGMEVPAARPEKGEAVVRLERLRRAMDQLTALLTVATSAARGGSGLLSRLAEGGGPIDHQVATAALAMRRLGALMLSDHAGEVFLVAPSAAAAGEEATRAVWSDFLAALAFLTGVCQRRTTTLHLAAVDATAEAIESLCGALAEAGFLSSEQPSSP